MINLPEQEKNGSTVSSENIPSYVPVIKTPETSFFISPNEASLSEAIKYQEIIFNNSKSDVHNLDFLKTSFSPSTDSIPVKHSELLNKNDADKELSNGKSTFFKKKIERCNNFIRCPLCFIFLFQIIITIAILSIVVSIMSRSELEARTEAMNNYISNIIISVQNGIVLPLEGYIRSGITLRLNLILNTKTFKCRDDDSSFEGNFDLFIYLYNIIITSEIIQFIYIDQQSIYSDSISKKPYITECGVASNYIWKSSNKTLNTSSIIPSRFPFDIYYNKIKYNLSLYNINQKPDIYLEDSARVHNGFRSENISISHYFYKKKNFEQGGSSDVWLMLFSIIFSLTFNSYFAASKNMSASLSIDINMEKIFEILITSTPKIEGSHSTLYDITISPFVVTSTSFNYYNITKDREGNDTANAWLAGRSPDKNVNKAYYQAVHLCPTSCDKVITKIIDNSVLSINTLTFPIVKFFMVQSTPKYYYFGKMEAVYNKAIILGVIGSGFIIFICLFVMFAIRFPINKLKKSMDLAAKLRNEEGIRGTSFLSEMQILNESFNKMNEKLLVARAFMPQSYLVDDDNNDENEDNYWNEMDIKSNSLSFESISSLHSNSLTPRILPLSSNESHSSINLNPSRESFISRASLAIEKAVTSHLNIATKQISVLALNVRGFHEMAKDPTKIISATRLLLTKVQSVLYMNQNIVDSYHGDHIVITFNTTKRVSLPGKSAVICALLIRDSLVEVGMNNLSIGAALGFALVGNMGNNVMKRFSIVGKVYSEAIKLEQASNRLEQREGHLYGPFGCLVNTAIAAETETMMDSQLIGLIYQNKGHEPISVYSISQLPNEVKNDEWMYQLADSTRRYYSYNNLLLNLIKGNFEDCVTEFSLWLEKNSSVDIINNLTKINYDNKSSDASNDNCNNLNNDRHDKLSIPNHYKRLKSLISYHYRLTQFKNSTDLPLPSISPPLLQLSKSSSFNLKNTNDNQDFCHLLSHTPFISNKENYGFAAYWL